MQHPAGFCQSLFFRPRANDLGHAEPRPAMAPQRRDTATRAKVDLNKRCSATINGVFHQKWGPYLSLVPRHHPAIERWLIFPFTSSPSSDQGVSTTIHHSSPLWTLHFPMGFPNWDFRWHKPTSDKGVPPMETPKSWTSSPWGDDRHWTLWDACHDAEKSSPWRCSMKNPNKKNHFQICG